jgi:hypothetical protein
MATSSATRPGIWEAKLVTQITQIEAQIFAEWIEQRIISDNPRSISVNLRNF